jgi:hypothetical protein
MVRFLLFDGVIHRLRIAPVVKASEELGFPLGLSVAIGAIELKLRFIVWDSANFGAWARCC